jgi:type IV pilus assembly protein PilW
VSHHRRQSGFSVVELMVSMTISLLLLAGVLSVLYTSRITYDENARVSRLQEYARASVELMLRDLRSAGNQGCARPIRPERFRNALAAPNDLRYNFDRAVEGFEGTAGAWAPALDPIVDSATAGNDVLVVRSLVSGLPPFRTSAAFAGGTGTIPLEKPAGTGFPTGTPLVISDCEYANVFANSATVDTAGTTVNVARAAGALAAPAGAIEMPQNTGVAFPNYRQGSLVTAIETVVYYIRDSETGRGPALWRIVGNGAPQELVEGVERLEVQFGEDTNGDLLVDVYRDADDVVNWASVISVSMAVLLRSPEEGLDESGGQTWNMLGTDVGPFADRRPRILFTTTATVRNRAPDMT